MKYIHEHVHYQEGVPIRVFVHNQHYIPLHWHKEIEILLILSGCAQVMVGQLRFDLQADDMLIVNCNEMHSTSTQTAESPTIMGVQIDPAFCGTLLLDIEKTWFKNGSFLEKDSNRGGSDWLRYYLARLLWETIEKTDGYHIALRGIVYLIISYMMRNCQHCLVDSEYLEISEKKFDALRRILSYLDSHYMEKLSLQDIAASQGMSYYYLSHIFKAQVGVSFSNYLNSVRLAKALDLLSYSDQKIIDIIYSCGFSGPEFFYQFFNKKQHCTPLEYRKKNQPHMRPGADSADSFVQASTRQGRIGQIKIIVERLMGYLTKFQQDRTFSDNDKTEFLSLIQKNNPRQTRFFSTIHFNQRN